MLTWVTPHEVPGGLLGARCDYCGHAYGIRWLYEPVPDEVLRFLGSLPEAGEGALPSAWSYR
jgi:hypothetical protein